MDRYHYLGSGPLCGSQIRYLSASERFSYIGCCAYSGAAWQLSVQDRWIGWDKPTRIKNLPKVICDLKQETVPYIRLARIKERGVLVSAGGWGICPGEEIASDTLIALSRPSAPVRVYLVFGEYYLDFGAVER